MRTDLELERDVVAELRWEPSVETEHIEVTVKDGVVTLSGYVPSYGEKCGAERAAKRVHGVQALANALEVDLPGTSRRTDEDIVGACLHALRVDASVPDDTIHVVVRGGVIELEGKVGWQYQKAAAEDALRNLIGVVGVVNRIEVESPATAGDVTSLIEAAFRRSAELDAHRIQVETHGGEVTLRGTLRSWAERDQAQRAAWAAPGVTAVKNQIRIET